MQSPPEGVPDPTSFEQPVVLYVTPWCGYCWAALRLLDGLEIPYAKINVTGNPAARRWLAQATEQRTVPQIFIRGRSIGGYTELAALNSSGGLAAALRET